MPAAFHGLAAAAGLLAVSGVVFAGMELSRQEREGESPSGIRAEAPAAGRTRYQLDFDDHGGTDASVERDLGLAPSNDDPLDR